MKECVPSQTSFRFTSQPCVVGAAEERLHAGVLGDFGEGIGQEGAGGIGDAMEILVRRRDGQVVDERRVQDPEEVAESVGDSGPEPLPARCQGKGGAEELDVVAFVRRPYPGAGVEVFGEIDQDAGEVAKRIGRQTEGVVGEVVAASRRASAGASARSWEDASRLVPRIPWDGVPSSLS